ncbi:membrane-associated progesterone receptor component 1 [Drosophila rhopaloa]|uniref:Membrane-associated progesterone receptor component 1 n=1 Tax=Drosophila rhopaloa TaxID=1041015 RepID=A0A6P4F3L2_DRORH|nr:membrane-associated progesterone receptor component 1 [Drosophila rhopaloa]XP_016983602.1 membrane-associated progesterone receptor component 1 [Drosophila rhopaloa]XP_016983603.1 membrane-associated progesterone receptor component 1 [Drosophila rhopaloa]XP_016983604.1 membrane-associated progesterone receptor component 1 [Drosophila rhopaloa]
MESKTDQTQNSVYDKETENIINNDDSTFLANILREILYSPMNLALLAIICFLVYKIVRDRTEVPSVGVVKPFETGLPKIRRDFTVKELRQYDGNQPDGRVLVAVNGSVYDVSKGRRFYGPGGPYATFAGRDASRNLATFSVDSNDKDEYDDLSDLSAVEMDSVKEWEMQFKEKYELVGKLLRRGEQPTNYDDDEDDENVNSDETTGTNEQTNSSRKRLPKSKTETDERIQESHVLQGNNATINNAQDEPTSTDC